jgi:dihydroflavonol-4-reductase
MLLGSQCLVTGGTGFIGRHVVESLLAHTGKVRVLCRSRQKARMLFGDSVELVVGDLLDSDCVERACRGVTVVFHLGGAYQFGRRDRQRMLQTNLSGTRNVLAAAWTHRCEKVIHVSSSGILCNRRAPITENDFPANVPPEEPYRHSKWLAECAALEWVKRGLPVTIASPTSPLGPGDDGPTPTGRIVTDFLDGRFPFAARTAMNFVAVTELAGGIIALAERGRAGQRYILGHHNLWLDDFLRVLERCTRLRAPRYNLPWPVIAAAGCFGELAGLSRLCWETAQCSRKRHFFDLRKAGEELGWKARIPIETSARASIAWFRRTAAPPTEMRGGVLTETNVAAS